MLCRCTQTPYLVFTLPAEYLDVSSRKPEMQEFAVIKLQPSCHQFPPHICRYVGAIHCKQLSEQVALGAASKVAAASL